MAFLTFFWPALFFGFVTITCFAKGCPEDQFGNNCTYQCHCAGNQPCHQTNGSCPNGCASGWKGEYCQRGSSIGDTLPATQSSTYRQQPAHLAVDGYFGQHFQYCTHTVPEDRPWWKVDLGKDFVLFVVKIWNRSTSWKRLKNFKIHMDDNLCYHYTGIFPDGGVQTIRCNLPIVGRYLKIQLMDLNEVLTLCEVQAEGYQYIACQNKRYGPNCNNRCQCASDVTCDDKTGECPTGCNDRYTGPYCNIETPTVSKDGASTRTSISVRWPTTAIHDSAYDAGSIVSYKVYYSSPSDTMKTYNVPFKAGETRLNLTDVKPSTLYSFSVQVEYRTSLAGPVNGHLGPTTYVETESSRDFEAVDLQILPESMQFAEEMGNFCINITIRVNGIGARILEGDTIKGTLQILGVRYMQHRAQNFNFTVTNVEEKTRFGVGDGKTFSAIGTTFKTWLGSWICSQIRLLCVQINPGKSFADKEKANDWICMDIRDRMKCQVEGTKLPTCGIPAFPEFIKRPTDTFANINDSVVFECAIKPKKAKEIRWYFDGTQIQQGDPNFLNVWVHTGGVLMLTPVSSHHFGLYTCKATDWSGNTIQVTGLLEDKKQACNYLMLEKPLNRTLKAGRPVLLNCMADEADSMTWYKDGQPITDNERRQQLTYGQLLIRSISKTDEGEYECVAKKGSLTCSVKSTVRVFVNADEVCGLPVLHQPIPLDSSSRQTGFIVGGNDAPEGSSPWQAMLWFNANTLPVNKQGVALSRDFCAGVLIDDQWVVTAAHCIINMQRAYSHQLQASELTIRLGKRSRIHVSKNERNVSVAEIKLQAFNAANFDNDIALLKLAEHVEFSDHIRPICLGDANMNTPQRQALITGWGRLSTHGRRPTNLQQVTIPIRNRTECRQSTTSPLTNNMFCAGSGRSRGGDSCKGDSGGPLSVREGSKWYLLGLVSWGEGCGGPGKYGFYTTVANYKNWILETAGTI